eukprot:2227543-Prymnesium_polylepis.1
MTLSPLAPVHCRSCATTELRVAAEPDRRREWHGDGDGPSPCHSRLRTGSMPLAPSIRLRCNSR